MGACFHIDTVECDNCRGSRISAPYTPPPPVQDLVKTVTTGYLTLTDGSRLAAIAAELGMIRELLATLVNERQPKPKKRRKK